MEETDEYMMVSCDTCGCIVEPRMAPVHSDWHDTLITKADLLAAAVANPERIKVD